jgi:hypothetical protein
MNIAIDTRTPEQHLANDKREEKIQVLGVLLVAYLVERDN